MHAAQVHVHRGPFLAPTEKAQLWEDGDARVSLRLDAEALLHRYVAVPGSQLLMVGGCRNEVPAVDLGRGLGRAQGRMSSVLRRVVELCLLCDRGERLHGGGPQFKVAVMAGNNELGVAGAWRRVLQEGLLGHRTVCFVQQRVAVVEGGPGKPELVLGVVPAHARAVLKPLQGHLVDRLCRAREDPCDPLAVRVPQEVVDDVGVHCMDARPAGAVLQG